MGPKAKHIVNYKILENISSSTSLLIDFGGGLKTDEDLKVAFESGASMITGGSVAVMNPDLFISWLEKYGAEKIILGADHKQGKIAVSGWTKESSYELFSFIDSYIKKGIRQVICTDIERDGMLAGASEELYVQLLHKFPEMYLVASGGVGNLKDLQRLKEKGLPAAIVGKAIYEGKISHTELKEFIKN